MDDEIHSGQIRMMKMEQSEVRLGIDNHLTGYKMQEFTCKSLFSNEPVIKTKHKEDCKEGEICSS